MTKNCAFEQDLKSAVLKGGALDQEIVNLELVALRGEILTGEQVASGLSSCTALKELIKKNGKISAALKTWLRFKRDGTDDE